MSVIAKMKLDGTLDFSGSPLSKLSCVCENDLMAAYAKADEDKVFTKYSPWGEMKIASGFRDKKGNTQFWPGQKFYVVALKSATRPICAKAAHVHPCGTRVVHDFGSSKQVELAHDARTAGSAPSDSMAEHPGEFHWRMTIDNPPAVEFFEPGKGGYWVAFYDDTKFTMQEALADAHA